ncbi:MAG: hypothetical protein J7502_12455 [Flavisolibacter sp.]|nr:hypothetical protein [Flavisolibacter sp.]
MKLKNILFTLQLSSAAPMPSPVLRQCAAVVRNANCPMQEHVYIARKSRIIRQTLLIWLFVALQIAANILAVPTMLKNNQTWAAVFINVCLGALTIPSVFLFIRYYKQSVGKRLIVTYNSLKFIDERSDGSIELANSEISEIRLVENTRMSRLPWVFHEYFSFADAKGNKIVVTSYFMDLSEFWLDPLTRKVDSKKLVREERAYPIC